MKHLFTILYPIVVLILVFDSIYSSISNPISKEDNYDYEKGEEILLSKGFVNYKVHNALPESPIVVCLHCYLCTMSECSGISKELWAKNYTVVRFDLYGHGLSSYKSFGYYTLDDYVEQTLELLDKLELLDLNSTNKLNIIGTSIGGLIAFKIAIKHPNLINKLIADSPPGLRNKPIASYLSYSIINYPLQFISYVFSPLWLAKKFIGTLSKTTSPKLIYRLNKYSGRISLTGLQIVLGIELWKNIDIYFELKKVDYLNRSNVLITWGNMDKLCPFNDAISKLLYYIPDYNIIIYENCKHRCMRFCKERFIDDISRFIENDSSLTLYSISETINIMKRDIDNQAYASFRGIIESLPSFNDNFVSILQDLESSNSTKCFVN